MNIKIFNIRLDKDNCVVDQNRMNEFLDTIEVKLTSTHFVTTTTTDYWSAAVFYEPKKNAKLVETDTELSHEETKIFNSLRTWRNDLASQLGWSAFRVCHNSHLIAIAKEKPQTIEAFQKVKGFGETKTDKYGYDILAILNSL
jgi:superfamily II DNA helicase RecQ